MQITTLNALQQYLNEFGYGVNLKSLIGGHNPKVAKSLLADGIESYIMHLDPETDKRACPWMGLCSHFCLVQSGVPMHDKVKAPARAKRTRLAFDHSQLFVFAVIVAVGRLRRNAKHKLAIRLNGTSDIPFEHKKWQLVVRDWHLPLLAWCGVTASVGDRLSVFDAYQDVKFYDYSKGVSRFNGKLPKNYHLTFSLDGARNTADAKRLLNAGYSVAVPFYRVSDTLTIDGQPFRVIDGDRSDYRPNDPRGVIVGLKYKRVSKPGRTGRNKANNGFILESDSIVSDSGIIARAV